METEPVWTGEENLTRTGIRSPDRPARSESLYRLSYPSTPPPFRKISEQNLSAAKLLPATTFLIIYILIIVATGIARSE